jgi:hypothetical protein
MKLFRRHRERMEQIADEELAGMCVDCDPLAAATMMGLFPKTVERELASRTSARMSREFGSVWTTILMAFLSAIIQAAIKRWLEKRKKLTAENAGGA